MDDATVNTSKKKRKWPSRPSVKPCSVDGCGNNFWARGLCGTHYQQFRASPDFHRVIANITVAERFHQNYVVDPVTGCWVWKSGKNSKGYGLLWLRQGKRVVASRYSYEHHIGPIPPGLLACHHCDNPPCVNPAHIFLGTNADNMADMVRKGRKRRKAIS